MQSVILHESGDHRFILLNESEPGEEEGIRSNQYLITHGGQGVLLDPGGFGVMPSALAELLQYLEPEAIAAMVLSHQDPDIVGGLSTWLEMTQAQVYASRVWMRFLPHYGLVNMNRFVSVPDVGTTVEPAPGLRLELLPAHYLHSVGQINVYDPGSGILFSGDVGAGIMVSGHEESPFVTDLAGHLDHITDFHKRYMSGNQAARNWADRVAALAPNMIAPQHGPVYMGDAVPQFLEWLRELRCGQDLLGADGAPAL